MSTWNAQLTVGASEGAIQSYTLGQVRFVAGAWGGPGNEDHIMEAGYFSDDTDAQLSQIASRVRPGVKADGSADVVSVMAVNASAANAELIFATLHCDEFF